MPTTQPTTVWTWTESLSIAANVSTVIAAVVAIIALNQWRKSLLFTRRLDLAEEALVAAYQARDAIARIRNIFGHSEEGKTRKRAEGESAELSRALDDVYVPIERLNAEAEVLNKFYGMRYAYQARFGKASVGPFEDLMWVVWEIRKLAHRVARHIREAERGYAGREQAADQALQQLEVIRWDEGEGDKHTEKINRAVAWFEDQCKKLNGVQ